MGSLPYQPVRRISEPSTVQVRIHQPTRIPETWIPGSTRRTQRKDRENIRPLSSNAPDIASFW